MELHYRRLSARLSPWLLMALIPVALSQTADTSGKWRVTVTMQMAGLSLPARTMDVCNKDTDHNAVPVSKNKDCEIYDVSRSGNTQSFKMRCTGAQKMDGSGVFTYTGDHYSGKVTASTGGNQMTMNYEGQRLGRCDGSEVNDAKKIDNIKQQIAGQQTAVGAAMAQVCQSGAADASSPYLFIDAYHIGRVQCTDAAQKQMYCTHFRTHKAFMAQAEMEAAAPKGNAIPGTTPLTDSAALCGVQVESVRHELCGTAEADNALDFLTSQCPTEVRAVVQRQCAGRDYTSMSAKYRDFCSKYGLDQVRGGTAASATTQDQAQPESTQDKAKDAIQKGRNALKGLFGR